MDDLYKPSSLLNFLQAHHKHPKKCLSQVFLTDLNILKKICKEASLQENDMILEIGPGPGVLTHCLLESKASVIAIEKDDFFASSLPQSQRLKVVHEDVLTCNLKALFPKKSHGKIKVVANIPYHISAPIVTKLLTHYALFSSCLLLVQKEFAKRLCASINTKDYASLSLFTQFYSYPKYCFTVSSSCFLPQPSIASAVVHLTCKRDINLSDTQRSSFEKLFRRAFEQRRKMLSSSLSLFYHKNKIKEALIKIGYPTTTRPQELSANHFLSFFNMLEKLFDKID